MSELKLSDIDFSENPWIDTSIKRKLSTIGIVYLDDLSEITYIDLLKLRTFGMMKYLLVERAMKEHKINFKDNAWVHESILKKFRKKVCNHF